MCRRLWRGWVLSTIKLRKSELLSETPTSLVVCCWIPCPIYYSWAFFSYVVKGEIHVDKIDKDIDINIENI